MMNTQNYNLNHNLSLFGKAPAQTYFGSSLPSQSFPMASMQFQPNGFHKEEGIIPPR